ncbi:MAG: outer membrane beta-barrel protein [Bacteroidales bacterium]|nr:outer membrane beta-barrel protein [Bacteroidales bacterium]
MAKYSLSQNTDMNVLRTSFNGRGSYTTKHGFEINSELFYVFYNGYSDGFGKPEWRWNASITKDIGAFTLSLRAHDILNQTRGLDYEITANYEEESYRLISGRHILFGVKWNFGKMNKVHSRRAQDAYWNMIW